MSFDYPEKHALPVHEALPKEPRKKRGVFQGPEAFGLHFCSGSGCVYSEEKGGQKTSVVRATDLRFYCDECR